MKHAKLFIAITALILLTSGFSYSQGMMPPKPLENEFFDGMVGNSSGENFINGKIHKENVEIKWDLNHQYIVSLFFKVRLRICFLKPIDSILTL